jgi:biopolymer transport protein TolR
MALTTREGKTQTTLAEINMIPFIDIVLVLLIIFMVTAPVIQSGIEINVPQTKIVKEIAEEKLVVLIDKKQDLYLGNDPVNINELEDKIHQKLLDPTRKSVYLMADKVVPFQMIATVLDTLKHGGIENVVIVTQPLDNNKK